MSSRVEWVDIAKGLGILLVVMGHSDAPGWVSDLIGAPHYFVSQWIWSFHMPLFFLLSGLCSKWNTSYRVFVYRKCKTLGLYFFIYSSLNLLALHIVGRSAWYVVLSGWGGYALWFLSVLILCLLLAGLIPARFVKLAIIFFLLVAWGVAHWKVHFRWNLSSLPYATALILLGRTSAPMLQMIAKENNKRAMLYAVSCLLIFTPISFFWRLDLQTNMILPLLPLLLSGILGTLFVAYISLILTRICMLKKVLSVIGYSSLEIMAFHQVVLIHWHVPLFVRLAVFPVVIYVLVLLRSKYVPKYFRRATSADET